MRNLEKAYNAKDSTEYKSLFDENYQGSSIDQTSQSTPPLSFSKTAEERHIAALAKSAAVVDLQLWPLLFRLPGTEDPSWALIQNPIFRLEIREGTDVYVLPSSVYVLTEFQFKPALDGSSPTDTIWTIIKWQEVIQKVIE